MLIQQVYPYGRSNQRKCIKSKVSCLNNECSFWLARKQIENDFFDKKNYNKNLLDIANDIASMRAWMSKTPMHKTIYVPKQNFKKNEIQIWNITGKKIIIIFSPL